MTKRFTLAYNEDWWAVRDGEITLWKEEVIDLLNELNDENEQLKVRFKEEREFAMRLGRECDTLTIKKQELELEIERLEAIIKTGKR